MMTSPYLSKHESPDGQKWALNGHFLERDLRLDYLLGLSRSEMMTVLEESGVGSEVTQEYQAPIEAAQEIWASGVTYLRSRDARMSESSVGDIYDRVYDADRPEIFFKTLGWRSVGHNGPIRVREDSQWNVPEPELVLVINSMQEIVGYTAGDDVSSRAIEGENPLYLPQAKSYDGSCAIGPGIVLCNQEKIEDLQINLEIFRNGQGIYRGETRTSQMKRRFEDLSSFLFRELSFPSGVFLMTGTGIIPGEDFNLEKNDLAVIKVGDLELRNIVA